MNLFYEIVKYIHTVDANLSTLITRIKKLPENLTVIFRNIYGR